MRTKSSIETPFPSGLNSFLLEKFVIQTQNERNRQAFQNVDDSITFNVDLAVVGWLTLLWIRICSIFKMNDKSRHVLLFRACHEILQ